MNRGKIVILTIVMSILLSEVFVMGCTENGVSRQEVQEKQEESQDITVVVHSNADLGVGSQITKYYDAGENVICYIYSDGGRGGISCVRRDGVSRGMPSYTTVMRSKGQI
jgi:hypothetical protein